MNTIPTTELYPLPYRIARRQMTRDIQETVMWKNPYLRTLAIQSREGFREVYGRAKSGSPLDLIAIVSPPYTNSMEISNRDDYFSRESSWLESRVPKKLLAAVSAIEFLKKYFTFKIQIAIADTGLLLSQQFVDATDIEASLSSAESMYQKRVSELLDDDSISTTRMSKLVREATYTIVDMQKTPTIDDCKKIIIENAISPRAILDNLPILINAFGVTVAYYELRAYFAESRLLWENLWRTIIVNIEWTSVWNKLLTKWQQNLCIDRKSNEWNREDRKWWNLLIGWTVTL